jgi:outer membrane protein OmpA-like peptidoglycan-associated protein
MKNKFNFLKKYIMSRNIKMIRKIFIHSLLLFGIAITSQAQVTETPFPKLWIGVSGAANFNFYSGTTQTMNATAKATTAFHNGFGIAPYASFLIEYRPKHVFGVMLNIAYDDRSGKFDQVLAPCNCPENLSTKLTYIAIEPSIRISPFPSNFYLFVGLGINKVLKNSFTYTQEKQPNKSGDLTDMQGMMYSSQIGVGYDIPLSAKDHRTQWELSPFVSYHPYFGQSPRTVESLSIQTVRAGIALKFGRAKGPAVAVVAKKVEAPVVVPAVIPAVIDPGVQFTVRPPAAVPAKAEMKETFPLRNYVYFDLGSTEIPGRYVKLNKEQASNFKEGEFQTPEPNELDDRSKRQLNAYHNVLNILGDRMRANPNITVMLIGSSAGKGPEVGKAEAESVKRYLVDVFGISGARITTEGRNQPIVPSEHPGGTKDLVMLQEGDRRVDIISNTPVLIAPLQIVTVKEEPADSRVLFKAQAGKNEKLKSWTLEIKDEKGVVQNYGPFNKEEETVSGNAILGDRAEGNFTVVMVGTTEDGNTIRRESTLHLIHDTAPKQQSLRFSVLYDFDKSKTQASYEKFLNETVAPLITDNSTVIIHGHADVTGTSEYNMKLSQERSRDAQVILERAVAKSGKKGVKFQVDGLGSDPKAAPFSNTLPEERGYNRTVIIDVVPAK